MTLHIGTSGFSYDDWEPFPYPTGTRPRKMFECYCEWFNAVEINSTFYHIPTPSMMRGLVRRAAGRVAFAAKMSERVTHYGELDRRTVAGYSRSVEPAADAGALGAILLQFPFRFHHTAENRHWLLRALESFRAFPLVVEIRHATWQTRDGLDFFRDRGISLCILDMPRRRNFPRTLTELTGPTAYVRFHGRNGTHWFRDAYPGAPYDYMYSDAELASWTEPVRELRRAAQTTFVFFNNHVRGQAPANAVAFGSMLGQARGAPLQSDFLFPEIGLAPRGRATGPSGGPSRWSDPAR